VCQTHELQAELQLSKQTHASEAEAARRRFEAAQQQIRELMTTNSRRLDADSA
jgi:hypothetical protein